MIFRQHIPGPPLAEYVAWFWFYADFVPDHSREHVLPDGSFELIINLQEQPRKLFDRANPARYTSFKRGWISGAHSEYLVIDALPASSMIGIHFNPGGIAPFLGPGADELRNRVVELDAVWGTAAWDLRDRLLAASSPPAKFQILEQQLLRRLGQARATSRGARAVRQALGPFLEQPDVLRIGEVVENLGVSHKHFIAEFTRRVGMPPKLFCRIRRFQQVLAEIGSRNTVEWTDVALSCGYYDQPHFINDFQAFSGVNPREYLGYRLEYPNFIRADD